MCSNNKLRRFYAYIKNLDNSNKLILRNQRNDGQITKEQTELNSWPSSAELSSFS